MSVRPTVLVIDDSELCLDLAREALEKAGFTVVVTLSPIGASRLLRECGAAVVVIDVAMPAMSGDKLVDILKRSTKTPVPIVLHSDRPLSELGALAARAGATDAVAKTDSCVPLVAAVRRVLAGRAR